MVKKSIITIIEKKRDGNTLDFEEIEFLINELTAGNLPDYQLSAFLMAGFINGMNVQETDYLTKAMLYSGDVLNFENNLYVDKHSTGGVGDKATFILAPLASALGVKTPMVSGRSLGHTGGTVDKLESIKGFSPELSEKDFIDQVEKMNLSIISQTKNIAPADKLVYAMRDVSATVPSIAYITASIMSKKLASGVKGLVFDVKFGNGAFMKDFESATELAKSLIRTAKNFNKNASAFITNMNQPLGIAIGNSNEIIESIEVLKGRGPEDTKEISVMLASEMVLLAKLAQNQEEAIDMVLNVLENGEALEKLEEMLKLQGADTSFINDYSKLPQAPLKKSVHLNENGFIKKIDTKFFGNAIVSLGGGRSVQGQKLDHGVGINLFKKIGDQVNPNDSVAEILYNDNQEPIVEKIINDINNGAIEISPKKVQKPALIAKYLTN